MRDAPTFALYVLIVIVYVVDGTQYVEFGGGTRHAAPSHDPSTITHIIPSSSSSPPHAPHTQRAAAIILARDSARVDGRGIEGGAPLCCPLCCCCRFLFLYKQQLKDNTNHGPRTPRCLRPQPHTAHGLAAICSSYLANQYTVWEPPGGVPRHAPQSYICCTHIVTYLPTHEHLILLRCTSAALVARR